MDKLKPSPANSTPLTPLSFLERAATIYGDGASLVYKSTTFTWSETHLRCLRLASSIASLGIQRGDIVSVLAPNIPAMYELHFSAPMAGAVLNTINVRLDSRTVSVLLAHSESKLLFVDSQFKALVADALSGLPPDSRRPILVLIADNEYPTGIGGEFVGTYEGMVENGNPNYDWVRPETEYDPIVLNYTSGTTSAPKGVVHSHRGIFITSLDSLVEWSFPKRAVYLWTLPMFHSNGWCFPWGTAAVGATNICIRKVDAAAVYSAIHQHNVTHMCAAPVVLNMLSHPGDGKPLARPVQIMTGGAPPPAAVLLRMESLGFVVTHVYGLSETAGVFVSCSWKEKWDGLPAMERARLKARQGVKTLGMVEVDVVHPETGAPVKRDGETLGEIVLRGCSIFLGYLKDPEGTAKSLRNGWFYTGDVGVMHPDGYLEIKDRSKDVIISGGVNLSSVEVESVLYGHPAVNEAAVVARPDEFWGETPCAFVTLNPHVKEKRIDEEIIREYCRANLPRYMVPKTVVFMEELPKTSTGKIQKFVLRNMAKTMGRSSSSKL